MDVAANTAKLQTDVQKIHGQLDNVSSIAGKVGTALAGAFTITAITGAATQVLNYASKIADLSAQTGLTTKTIQEMQHAANLTGASLEKFTNAAFSLGTKIAGGGDSVVNSLNKLGLSYEQLRQMSPDQQFNVITAALGHVQNAQDRNKLAVELFGKSAQAILPAIAQGYDNLAKSAVVAGDAQIQALDMAGDALDSFLEGAKNLSVQLAGGLVIAIRETVHWINESSAAVALVKRGFAEWATVLETVGLKSRDVPKVLEETRVKASLLPQPLQAVSLSVLEQETRMKALEVQHRATSVSTQTLAIAQDEVDENIQRLTRSFEQQIEAFRRQNTLQNTVYDGFKLLRVEFTEAIPVVQNFTTSALEPFKAGLQSSLTHITTWGQAFKDTFTNLPSVILGAIQGGGSVLGAVGAHIGTSIMSKFQTTFGPAIEAALPFGIGKAITQLLPSLGALFGPVAEKIGQFFRNIFGGPSAEEIRGRQAVADFEAQLHSLLTETQRVEAGNQAWKMTVIAIRDAYIAQGLSENEALQAAERLWASSRQGGDASLRIIEEIKRIMQGGAAAAGDFAANLDSATRPRTIDIGFNVREVPDFDFTIPGPGFATGSAGIRNFGSGTPVVLHGRERVQTEAQMKAEQASNVGPLIDDMRRMMRDLPRAMKLAMKDALVGV